jgi:hypothetical protein
MPRQKLGNKRYGLYISPKLNGKLNEYLESRNNDYLEKKGKINAQDVLKQALTEFLEKHLK